ncbi:MAG TPA: M64 family metallopeptidase [Chitinophagales bacterium]|nr:M64 family metallopeptidase [Chitinophagales bacterium]
MRLILQNILLIAGLLLSLSGKALTVDTLIYNGNPANRINIVIMGDGYTAAQMSQFRTDALANANYFFTIPPFDVYKNFFNFFAIEVASVQSDIDHPGNGSDEATYTGHPIGPVKTVNNYFNSTFDYLSSVHRLIASANSTLINTTATSNFPQYDYVTILANSSYYGGSGGAISYSSTNTSAREIFMHEFGHSFGLLQDEYGGSSCTSTTTQKINTSGKSDTNVIWKNWLTKPYPSYPTPDSTSLSSIGIYVGGDLCNNNRYHPKFYCKMRVLNSPFCEVCAEQLVYRIDTSINYIDSYLPSSATPTVCKNTTQNFSTSLVNTTTNTVKASWYVDGALVVNNSTSFDLNTTTYGVGSHTVKLVTIDTSVLARKRLATYSRTWTVTVSNTNPVVASAVSNSVCSGSAINLTGSGATGYSWTYPNATTTTTQNPTINNATLADSGIYILRGTGTCLSTDTVKITMKSLPTVSLSSNSPVTTPDTIRLTSGGGSSYSWTGPNSFSSAIQNPKKGNTIISDSGYYKVTVTNNGCFKSDSVRVTVYFSLGLPVEMISFTGKAQDNNTTLLEWKTASEKNNDYFEIQHSKETIEWESIGTLRGNGFSNQPVSYSFIDENPYDGINYYRLKQVDFDGKFEYSYKIAVNFETPLSKTKEQKFTVYPNPASGNEIWIKSEQEINSDNAIDVRIYNSIGENVYNTRMDKSVLNIKLTDHPRGTYFIKTGYLVYKLQKE